MSGPENVGANWVVPRDRHPVPLRRDFYFKKDIRVSNIIGDKRTMKLNGSQLVCESLLREDGEIIFGLPGGAILPLYQSLPEYPALRHILVRHEQGASLAADGYARVSGKPGVAFATSGPGATNLVTGIASAQMDSVPLVIAVSYTHLTLPTILRV